MKKLIIISAMVLGGLSVKTADAQIGFRINVNLGSRPVYVPAPEPEVVNEPVYDDYYYLPEVEAYYSVGEHCYYYQDGNRWIAAAYLPGMYHNFDWRTARRFEIHSNRPYMNHETYRGRFGGYRDRADFYARAYPGRDRYDRDPYRGRDQYDNRGWGQPNRGGFDRNDDRDRNNNNYNQPEPNRNQGGYGQPNQGGYNRGGNDQQSPGRNQGGYNQPNQGQNQGGNQQQPQQGQGQQGGRGNGQNQDGGNNGRPANHGQDRSGNNGAEQHYAANKMGMIQDRGDFASRPVRP